MSELLLTGASGFLGGIMKSILYLHFRVRTLGQREANDFQVDLANDIPELNKRFDLVVHCAGKAHFIPKSEGEKKEIFDVNLQGTKNLCYALEKDGLPSSFIFISTVAVYGIEIGL
jgi:nucleoside-diphosphate-sugar epimerase